MNKTNTQKIMKLTQQFDQAEKEQKNLKLDLKTIPEGIDPLKAQREIQNEHDALQMSHDFSENRINDYINRVDDHMEHYIEDLDAMFKNTQSRLFAHFQAFGERVQRKFESHIMRNTIEKKFTDMSPVRTP